MAMEVVLDRARITPGFENAGYSFALIVSLYWGSFIRFVEGIAGFFGMRASVRRGN